ncbi:MAG: hypothetical protein BWY42_01649 [Candidatus Omnitrophica bacterium ADurb.Bin277]|nr:MAG: hypothetical protein BWY42_01649 [Candidatus Omnitrophica bacterium ADurb.Bin277]
MLVNKFDRVFCRNDMPGKIFIDIVQHRRKGGRLSGSRRSRHKDQSSGKVQDFYQLRREPHILERIEPGRKQPQNDRIMPLLLETRNTEPRFIPETESKINAADLFDLFTLDLGRDLFGQCFGLLGR